MEVTMLRFCCPHGVQQAASCPQCRAEGERYQEGIDFALALVEEEASRKHTCVCAACLLRRARQRLPAGHVPSDADDHAECQHPDVFYGQGGVRCGWCDALVEPES
jgi:hypothetical protein